ncbi:tRNA (adenosine(37)-N6)-threonylcarbamoyltransferase complex dimerization subunit type 1 TsaB [Vagococcus carniphilus]|uniref:tRNA (adenosine(37)-N6)-threonylcarbamoyltransferase complex dimerization subunit type 1 TsaB n=1 Tax=Vagococcus carniphilus TaxID=218144 RepID=UPI00288CEA06|nr:tRNA (adenosine(37)-N6)-threonylcarbamoyltransferase complex dimerization subunit type 1 TsaB [Vagococcus carniphilus]MDT2831426.1 tRNA (adenosine(37)-N6)-threonylcarbamoyltransferase complex dimerization subunit type 1 TsaB [Vagococcus carniphilus]MDT2840148.1 tRNA (adenosine(37)-N6)-threonylcarbamoyltransferase complex dimerization subunit type 1 TsaB [Vagococcus carniphilus]MDT2855029.1 tRNA (adenosine(37)-N6)-threonylcarbamoyltransferase complex dimerization subunit type 1 TsaB [Vagococcu
MTVLGIDTSNQSMSLCLGENNKLIGSYFTATQKNHSATLMPAIDFLFESNNKQPKDLEKIIVAEGPGSYTGLRIGVTTAKTLAWTLNLKLYSVSSLALIAASKKKFDGLIVPIVNARRQNVYTGAYQWQDNQLISVIGDQHIFFESWLDQLAEVNQPIFFVGADLPEFFSLINQREDKEMQYDESPLNNEINPASFLVLENLYSEIENIEKFTPRYLKKVEAEEKWLETHVTNEDSNYVERV